MPDEPKPEQVWRIALAYETLQGECPACRAQIQPDWQFCAHCSIRLATICPNCGVPLPPAGATHCGHCGVELPPHPER